MESAVNFISNLGWQDWAAAIGIIFGIVTLLAYLDQRRSNKQQSTLIEFVNRHLDKDISDETIKELKVQREAMEEQVKEHIPALARTAVLKEQAEAHAAALSHHYKEWHRINTELDVSPTAGHIDKDIENIIIDRIVPKYERQWALDTVRNRITALSIAIALSSTFLFYPLTLLVGIPLAFPLVKGLLEFVKLQGASQKLLKNIKFIIIILYFVGIFWLGLLGVVLILNSDVMTTDRRVISTVSIVGSLVAMVFARKFIKLIEKFLQEQLVNKSA